MQEESRLAKRTDPVRTCIGCRRRARSGELERCALLPDGSVIVSSTASGRGAWVCRASLTCLDEAVRRRRFERAFRRSVNAGALASLRKAFAAEQHDVKDLTLVKG